MRVELDSFGDSEFIRRMQVLEKEAVTLLAYTFQDDVIEEQHKAWPEVNGRPLWASAASGVACW